MLIDGNDASIILLKTNISQRIFFDDYIHSNTKCELTIGVYLICFLLCIYIPVKTYRLTVLHIHIDIC